MYGWLDDQVTRVLQRGFVFYAGDLVAWRKLFPPYVAEAARDELHAIASQVTSAIAFQHATDVKAPIVTVEVSDGGSPELTFFGDAGDDAEYAELGLREAIILRVCAATKHEVRAMTLATRSILLSYRNRLFLGEYEYSDFRYLAGTAASPNRDYFPEQFGGFLATQTWGTMGEAYVPLIEPTVPLSGDLLIARDTVTFDDGAGGTTTGGAHGTQT